MVKAQAYKAIPDGSNQGWKRQINRKCPNTEINILAPMELNHYKCVFQKTY